jgi:hypothetical protein
MAERKLLGTKQKYDNCSLCKAFRGELAREHGAEINIDVLTGMADRQITATSPVEIYKNHLEATASAAEEIEWLKDSAIKRTFLTAPSGITAREMRQGLEYGVDDLLWTVFHPDYDPPEVCSLVHHARRAALRQYIAAWRHCPFASRALRPDWLYFSRRVLPVICPPKALQTVFTAPKRQQLHELMRLNPGKKEILKKHSIIKYF